MIGGSMRASAAALGAFLLAGCSWHSNPYDSEPMAGQLNRHDEAYLEMQRAELAARLAPKEHDYKGHDHELSDWREAVLDKADPPGLARMRSEAAARIAELEAKEKDLVSFGDPTSAEPLVDVRRNLAVEKYKLAQVDAKLGSR